MLRVRIHRQIDSPSGEELVWEKALSGQAAQKALADLESFGSDPRSVGELLSFRIKDGNGGGSLIEGCFLDLKIQNTCKESQTADVYFHADKWRHW